jgi:hypothetical protein
LLRCQVGEEAGDECVDSSIIMAIDRDATSN